MADSPDIGKYGRFLYPFGYSAVRIGDRTHWWSNDIWEVTLPKIDYLQYVLPTKHLLTFITETGYRLRPPEGTRTRIGKRLRTDYGSIPRPVQLIPGFGATDFLFAYLHHDDGYSKHGITFQFPGSHEWLFLSMQRESVDMLLPIQIGAQGGNAFRRGIIFDAVDLFGGATWDDWADRPKRMQKRVDVKMPKSQPKPDVDGP